MLECGLRLALALGLSLAVVHAQSAPARLIGVISALAQDGKGLVVKTDSGEEQIVALLEDARVQRVAPGEKDLSKAAPAAVSDLAPGDRILARGEMQPGGKVLLARQIIVITRDDLAKKQQAERAEWAKRGAGGIVASKNESQRTLTLRIPGLEKDQIVEVALSENTKIRRYAPDSVRYADAKPSALGEIQPGDQVRVLGNRDSEGKKILAEEIVSGAFQTIAGSVVSVRPDGSGFSVKDLRSGKPVSVRTTVDSVVKRLPDRGPGFGMGGMGPGMSFGGGMGGGAPDLQRMLEFLPPASVNDLKPGETVLLAATRAADAQPVTAITVLANADTLLAIRQAISSRQRGGPVGSGSWTLDMPVTMGP